MFIAIGGLAQSTSLTLRLHKGQNVSLADWALNVTDDGARVVHELNADLSDLSTSTGSADDLGDLGELNLSLIHLVLLLSKSKARR